MAQKVLRVGSSAAVTIPKSALDKLGLKIGDMVVVETDTKKKSFTVRPATKLSQKDKHIAELTFNFVERYRSDLESLAKK